MSLAKLFKASLCLALVGIVLILVWTDLVSQFVCVEQSHSRVIFLHQHSDILRIKVRKDTYKPEIIKPLADVLRDKGLKWIYVFNGECDISVSTPIFKPYVHIMPPNPTDPIKIFFTSEAYKPDPEIYDLSLGFDDIQNSKYVRLPYGYENGCKKVRQEDSCQPKKDFACFLTTNLKQMNWWNGLSLDGIKERIKVFHALSAYKKVKSGGKALNNIGHIVPEEQTKKFLSSCKFVIAYENQSYPGYLTEKVFNAYTAGAVPIYYGHPSVLADINKDAIIYAGDFQSLDALVDYVKRVDNDDKLYCSIWNQKLAREDKCQNMVNSAKQKFCKLLEKRLARNLSCNYF